MSLLQTAVGIGSAIGSTLSTVVRTANQVVTGIAGAIDGITKSLGTLSRSIIAIPLPPQVQPIVVPINGEDEPWLGSAPNNVSPMSFFLNIDKNQSSLIQGISTIAGIVGALGGPDLTGGLNTVRGPVDQIGGTRKVASFRDFGPLSRTTFLPTGINGATTAAAVLRQVFVPPLTLLVNPDSFDLSETMNFSEQRMYRGPVVEFFGSDMPTLSCRGKTAGFFTGSQGLNRRFKTPSLSFQQLISLYFIYRNNGNDYNPADSNQIHIVGAVTIFYDGTFYVGSFENFEIREDATAPFRFEYSFTFRVRRLVRSIGSDFNVDQPFTNIPL